MRVPVSAAERGECLAGMHAGALSAAVGTAGRRLAVSVWSSYQPGGLLTVRDRPPVAYGRSCIGPTAGSGSGIVIARADSSPRQNILFGAA